MANEFIQKLSEYEVRFNELTKLITDKEKSHYFFTKLEKENIRGLLKKLKEELKLEVKAIKDWWQDSDVRKVIVYDALAKASSQIYTRWNAVPGTNIHSDLCGARFEIQYGIDRLNKL